MDIIKFIFGSLFSNKVALDGRKKAWWLAIVVFLISMILAVIPTMVTINKINGSDILDKSLNGAESAMYEFVERLNEEGINIVVEPSTDTTSKYKYVLVNKNQTEWNEAFGENMPYEYKAFDGKEENVRFRIYSVDLNAEDTQAFRKELIDKVYVEGSELPAEQEKIVSFMILGRETLNVVLYKKDATKGATVQDQMTGVYAKNLVNTNIKSFKASPTSTEAEIMERWGLLFDKSYAPLKANTLQLQVSVYFGVNVLVVLMIGLMIFVMTRGKHNPNRDFTFLEALKVSAFLALCPAILTVIVGFIAPAYASIVFMLSFGLRTMWMSTKNLKPVAA